MAQDIFFLQRFGQEEGPVGYADLQLLAHTPELGAPRGPACASLARI